MKSNLWFLVLMLSAKGLLCAVDEKSKPTQLEPYILIFPEQVVTEQWPATLDLVNAPADLKQVEPGQCIRLGIVATGDGRDTLLKQTKFTFEIIFLGKTQAFASEQAEAVKQIKPQGNDFVTQALGSVGIKNPVQSLASLAASRASWCVPVDVQDGTATIHGSARTADGKTISLKAHSIAVKTFETARKQLPFKDSEAVGGWITQYYQAPDPALLFPALRIIALDENARKNSGLMVFFVAALKAHKPAAEELAPRLSGEESWVRRYSAAALKWSGYPTESLVSGFPEEDQSFLNRVQQPDPFDKTPGADIGARQDMLWSIFFATGNIEPVRAIASELAWADDYRQFKKTIDSGQKPDLNASTFRAAAYGAAGWSLGSLSNQDPLVADYIDAIKAAPDTSPVVKKELAHLFDNPAFRSPNAN